MNWNKAQEKATQKVLKAPVNPTKVTALAPKQFSALCKAIEAAYPDLTGDEQAVENAGVGKNGAAVKLAVYARPKGSGLPGANVTIYGSGKVVWTNLEPIAL